MAEFVTNHMFDRWLHSAWRYEDEWRRSNQQCFEYYDGDQWTEAERAEIENRGQQPTVINTIQPTVDMVCALEKSRKSDMQVTGREGSDDNKAQLLTELLKHVFDTCNFEYYHSLGFQEAYIGGRSWFEIVKKTDERGKDVIGIDLVPWENVYLDPFSRKPDASDARFIIKVKWVDRDIVKKIYPDAADLIDSTFTETYQGQEYEAQKSGGDRGLFYYDYMTQRVRVCECYYTMPESRKVNGKNAIVNAVHYVSFSDNIILEGSYEDHAKNVYDLGIDYYPLIPLYCMRDRKGRPRGGVKSLIDIQDQINKLNSKFLWSLAANRLLAEDGALKDPDEAQIQFQRPDGLVLLNDGGMNKIRVDDKYRDLSYMSAHLNFLLSTEQRISGVNDSMLGMGGTNERSGIMQSTRISQGAAMQSNILENMYFSQQRIALVVLRLIGKFYTDERIVRITQPNGTTEEYGFNIKEAAFNPATGEEETRILNKIEDTLHYDVIIRRVPPFSSTRDRMLQIFSEVLKAGVIPAPVAAKIMLTLADVPNKENLIYELENFYREQAALAAAAPPVEQ